MFLHKPSLFKDLENQQKNNQNWNFNVKGYPYKPGQKMAKIEHPGHFSTLGISASKWGTASWKSWARASLGCCAIALRWLMGRLYYPNAYLPVFDSFWHICQYYDHIGIFGHIWNVRGYLGIFGLYCTICTVPYTLYYYIYFGACQAFYCVISKKIKTPFFRRGPNNQAFVFFV